MIVITKYFSRQFEYYLKVEDNDIVMFDMKFECESDLHSVTNELSWMFSVRFNKEVTIINEL